MKLEFDYSRLLGRIYEKFGSKKSFCEAVGKSKAWIITHLDGTVAWKAEDIVLTCRVLEIPLEEAHSYFFREKV